MSGKPVEIRTTDDVSGVTRELQAPAAEAASAASISRRVKIVDKRLV